MSIVTVSSRRHHRHKEVTDSIVPEAQGGEHGGAGGLSAPASVAQAVCSARPNGDDVRPAVSEFLSYRSS